MGGTNNKITHQKQNTHLFRKQLLAPQKPEYSPVSQAGLDDTIEPIVEGGKQLYKKFTATGKNPIPLNLKALGVGTVAGVLAESATQNVLDDLNGGRTDNPYLANIQRLGSRMVGGATSGGLYTGNAPGAIAGAIGGAAIDIGENAIDLAGLTPEAIQLIKDRMDTNRREFDMQKRFAKNSKFFPTREAIRKGIRKPL